MVSREEKGNDFIEELEIKGNKFYFKEMSEWSIYRSSYVEAWQSAFQRNEMQESLEWMLGTKLNKTYLIEDSEGEIASSYSLLMNQCLVNKKSVNIGLCNNVFCNKKYFRYKLFDLISHLSLAKASKDYNFAYGFPNRLAIRGHRRVGWNLPDPVELFLCESLNKTNDTFTNISSEIRQLNSLNEEDVNQFCETISSFSKRSAEKINSSRIYKSFDYYFWRFFERNLLIDRDYYVCFNDNAICFFSVYKPNPQLNILDFQWLDNKSCISIISKLTMFIKEHSLPGFRFINKDLFDLLISETPNLNFKILDKIPLIVYEFNKRNEFNEKSINFSFSDYDVY